MVLFGVVMSLFGSHRMRALQEEVEAAREETRAARKLGPYTLLRRIGAGGMGEVYLAEHRLLKRPCAVKLIRPDRSSDSQALARFDREVQATARLKHPNTVEVFDYGRTDDGTFYYVMEYLDGLGLEEIVRARAAAGGADHPPPRTALRGPPGSARADLIHRDIKPNNVLLCRHGGLFDVVKLVDFGLVLHTHATPGASQLTQSGSVTGTPDYVSPEQADGRGSDPRSDLYSLGATAYYLLTGKPPYAGKTVLDILFAHRHQIPPTLVAAGVPAPAELEALVRRLLAKDPEDRHPSAEALEEDLRKCDGPVTWSQAEAKCWWESYGAHTAESEDGEKREE